MIQQKIAIPESIRWGSLRGKEIASTINEAYNEVISWRPNLFLVPTGDTGNDFIAEVTRLCNAFGGKSALESCALTMVITIIPLLLQKPSKKSKTAKHVEYLKDRLVLWKNGDIKGLIKEGKAIQDKISFDLKKNAGRKKGPKEAEVTLKVFTKLMLLGKVSQAVNWISNRNKGCGVHSVTPEIVATLADKHPDAMEASLDALLRGPMYKVEPVIYESIDSDTIYRVALNSSGSGGPSGANSDCWKRMLCSKQFKSRSDNLCDAVAKVARRLCSEHVNPDFLKAYNASRLIPLDKNPGVRPIGVGEMLRRLVGKAVTRQFKDNITEAAGGLQMCAGQEGGCEAAIHAIKQAFDSDTSEAVLLVDANNAFNLLNREAALNNIKVSCPSIGNFLNNSYQTPSALNIQNSSEVIYSKEGTTQGCTSASGWYACSTSPLAEYLQEYVQKKKREREHLAIVENCDHSDEPLITSQELMDLIQAWFADDTAAAGTLEDIKNWWDALVSEGPKYGYYPNASKTWLILKNVTDPRVYIKAMEMFNGTGVNITIQGKKHLGAAVGSTAFKKEYIADKVKTWVEDVITLATFAMSQPQLAYSAFMFGYQHKWTYFLRTIGNITDELQPLEDAIAQLLIPSIIGRQITPHERKIVSLPCRQGGLGILNPAEISDELYADSIFVTQPLSSQILQQKLILDDDTEAQLIERKKALKATKEERLKAKFQEVYESCDEVTQRALDLAKDKGASSWLTTKPLKTEKFCLNKQEFRDSICARYQWPIKDMPLYCHCGKVNDIDHALICPHGGFVIIRHNNVRDLIANLLSKVCKEVTVEPKLLPITGEHLPTSANSSNGARSDVSARGFWTPAQRAFFDVRINHPNAPSVRSQKPEAIFRNSENRKKAEYNWRIMNIDHGHFTPLVFGTTGGQGRECYNFLKRLAEKIAAVKKQNYSDVIRVIRTKIRFSILRSTLMAIRGSRGKVNKEADHSNVETDFNMIASQVDMPERE